MGYGEVGGNGSVHWRIEHHTAGGAKKNINHTTGSSPGNEQVTVAAGDASGKDSLPVGDVGTKPGHPGRFLVTLRYRTMAEASMAGSWVAQNVRPGPGGYYLTITVPAITTRPEPTVDLPYEIRIDW